MIRSIPFKSSGNDPVDAIDSLRTKIEYATEKGRDKHVVPVEDLQAYLAEIERLQAALRPFATMSICAIRSTEDKKYDDMSLLVPLKFLDAAHAALESE